MKLNEVLTIIEQDFLETNVMPLLPENKQQQLLVLWEGIKRQVLKEEPTELENDLEERLLSARNMIDLALLAFAQDQHQLVATPVEEAYYKLQRLVDDYCVVKDGSNS